MGKPESTEVAAILLLYVAVQRGDHEMINLLCGADNVHSKDVIHRNYLPHNGIQQQELTMLRYSFYLFYNFRYSCVHFSCAAFHHHSSISTCQCDYCQAFDIKNT